MPSPPTRRSRPTDGDRSLPIVPILIGVIVLGFVIGAGLSLSGRHDTGVVALVSPSPARHERFVPVTPAPTEVPTPQPTAIPLASERARIAERATPASATSLPATPVPVPARVTAEPAKAAPATLAASHRLAPQPAPPHVAAADVESPAPPTPLAARVTATPTEAADTSEVAPATHERPMPAAETTEPASLATPQGDPAFTRLSAAVVRQFLESVKRGDQISAFAVLASPPASQQDLAEYGVVDARTSVGRIDAHGAANDDAFVSVQMDTPNGPYFGQYTVHKSDSGAAVIVAHSIVKP